MVRINKVYTRTGDAGTTRLASGQSVPKTSPRIEAYGTVDELNSFLGFAAQACVGSNSLEMLKKRMLRIQNELFNLGSQLAVLKEDRRSDTPVIKPENITQLENEIDEMNRHLPALTSFILPGGGELSSRLHLARTVCRRAEREVLRLANKEASDGTEIPYLNRLGDWLFVAARYAASITGTSELLWQPGSGK